MTTYYRFTVMGNSDFPLDMLRYDACWPCAPESIEGMAYRRHEHRAEIRTVELKSLREPTAGRWASFMWKVTQVKKEKY